MGFAVLHFVGRGSRKRKGWKARNGVVLRGEVLKSRFFA